MYNPYIQQQVLQANGKASIDAIRLAPNSSVLVMDTTAPLVWLCVADSLGNVTSTPYDVKPHVDPSEATKQSIEERLTALEESIKTLKGEAHESHDGSSRSEQNHESDSADQTGDEYGSVGW